MAGFHVEKVLYKAVDDLIVLAGRMESGTVGPEWWIDLPREIRGPGWVRIADVQTVAFADRARLCLVLPYAAVIDAPLMEFSDLEGKTFDLRQP
jgi:hypothetical protein